MADLLPTATIAVADDRQAFGVVTSKDECITWDLRAYLDYGKGGASFTGLTLDPTQQYVVQSDVSVALNADSPSGSGLAGATYTFGTDGSGPSAGKKFLRGSATSTGAMTGVSTYTRASEEGLVLSLYRSAVAAGVASDFYLNFQPSGGSAPQYRLAIVPGAPIQLQFSADGSDWAPIATANDLGESEGYLESKGRNLTITVIPMTDPTWYTGQPQSSATSGPPPNLLVVNLNNGDSVLSVPCSTFPADYMVGFMAHGGQFGLRMGQRRYVPAASAALPPQVRNRNFATAPVARFQGYVPYTSTLTGTITTNGANQAAGSLTLNASSEVDATGFAVHTVFLSTLDADFPAGQVSPNANPSWTTYEPCLATARLSWDQKTGTLRSTGSITLLNSGNALSPGAGVDLGVRAGQLQFGYSGYSGSSDFKSGVQSF